jgi:hypothetical protein
MTMQTYTDPKLLDVRGALDALPSLPLGVGSVAADAVMTGTDASSLAPIRCKRSAVGTNADKTTTDGQADKSNVATAVSADEVKRKDPLTIAVNGSDEWALRGSNPRPHGCDPCALTS